jgi:hypothetical protein
MWPIAGSATLPTGFPKLTLDDVSSNVDLQRPPAGAWYQSDGGGTVIGATNRSLTAAFFMVIFALGWNSIVSMFVVFAIAGTLHVLHIPAPDWFPAPKMNGGDMGTGSVLFMWLFLTPFIAIGLMVLSIALSSLFGRTEVKIESTRGTLFTGVGPVGWKRQFDTSQVKDVKIYESYTKNGNPSFSILLETREGKQFKLGSLLSNERRQFMLGAMRKTLVR